MTLTVHEFALGDLLAADVSVDFSSNGLLAHGNLSKPVFFNGLELQNATLHVSAPPATSGMETEITLIGEIVFIARTLLATAYIYCPKLKDAKDSTASTRFEWTVSASMFRDKPLVLADLTPELRNSFLQDVALHNPVLLIASCDEPRVPKEVNIPPAIASKGEFILISM